MVDLRVVGLAVETPTEEGFRMCAQIRRPDTAGLPRRTVESAFARILGRIGFLAAATDQTKVASQQKTQFAKRSIIAKFPCVIVLDALRVVEDVPTHGFFGLPQATQVPHD